MIKFAFSSSVRASEQFRLAVMVLIWTAVTRGLRAYVKGYFEVPNTRGYVRQLHRLEPAMSYESYERVNMIMLFLSTTTHPNIKFRST